MCSPYQPLDGSPGLSQQIMFLFVCVYTHPVHSELTGPDTVMKDVEGSAAPQQRCRAARRPHVTTDRHACSLLFQSLTLMLPLP